VKLSRREFLPLATTAALITRPTAAAELRLFDSHFHIIDPRFPLVFVSSGDGVFIPAFSFPGFDSIPGVLLAKHRPKFPTALRGPLAKPLLKQDR
jgi:hypothetical protein